MSRLPEHETWQLIWLTASNRLMTATGMCSLTNRYKHLHGKFVIHPVDGRRLPIVCDAESVDMALGTGAVKV